MKKRCANCSTDIPGKRGCFKLTVGWVCGLGCFLCDLQAARLFTHTNDGRAWWVERAQARISIIGGLT